MPPDTSLIAREPLWTVAVLEDSALVRADLEDVPEGVHFIDRDGRITFWNRGAERITGFLRHEILGRRCAEPDLLFHCDDAGSIICGNRCPLRATTDDRRCRDVRLHLRHRDGYRLPVHMRSIPLKGADGSIIGAAEVFQVPHQCHAAASPRFGIPAALLSVDFERLRRNYGLDGATHVTDGVERTLRRELSDTTALGRLSKSQFLAVLADEDAHAPAETLARIRHVVEQSGIRWWGEPVRLEFAIAYSWVRPDDDLSLVLEQLVARLEAKIELI